MSSLVRSTSPPSATVRANRKSPRSCSARSPTRSGPNSRTSQPTISSAFRRPRRRKPSAGCHLCCGRVDRSPQPSMRSHFRWKVLAPRHRAHVHADRFDDPDGSKVVARPSVSCEPWQSLSRADDSAQVGWAQLIPVVASTGLLVGRCAPTAQHSAPVAIFTSKPRPAPTIPIRCPLPSPCRICGMPRPGFAFGKRTMVAVRLGPPPHLYDRRLRPERPNRTSSGGVRPELELGTATPGQSTSDSALAYSLG